MSDENNDSVLIDFLKEKNKREKEEQEEIEETIDWITSHLRTKEEIINDNPFVLMLEYIERVQLAERTMQRRIKLSHSLYKANLGILFIISLLTCMNFIFFAIGH